MTLRLVLVTGGLDSTVLLAWALQRGAVLPVHIRLPDRPKAEKAALQRVLKHYGLHTLLTVPAIPHTGAIQGSRDRAYVPGRNLYLLSAAHLIARSAGAQEILIGTLKGDSQDFADATPAFFRDLQNLFNRGRTHSEDRIRLGAPFHRRSKTDVARLGRHLRAPLHLTWSCYRDGVRPCGRCRACLERSDALIAASET